MSVIALILYTLPALLVLFSIDNQDLKTHERVMFAASWPFAIALLLVFWGLEKCVGKGGGR